MGNEDTAYTEVLGIIRGKNDSIIDVIHDINGDFDTFKEMQIDISDVVCASELYVGDEIILYIKEGERVHTINLNKTIESINGEVSELHAEHGIINDDTIFYAKSISRFSDLKRGDMVRCNVIDGSYEYDKKTFPKRCIDIRRHSDPVNIQCKVPKYTDNTANQTNRTNKIMSTDCINNGLHFPSKLAFDLLNGCRRPERYPLPNTLVEIVKWRNLNRVCEKIDEFVSEFPLSMGNYVQRFHGLLFLEETEMKIGFGRYKMDKVLLPQGKSRFVMKYANTQELRPAIQAGDFVHVREMDEPQRLFQGRVETVDPNNFILKIGDKFEENLSSGGYSISFHYNRSAFIRKHRAIDAITTIADESVLFPTQVLENGDHKHDIGLYNGTLYVNGLKAEWFHQNLNDQQKIAVKFAIRADCNLPFIIFGPPGTGKTSTLVEIILQIHKHIPNARVLVTTQTNAAANIVATRLIKECNTITSDLIRMVSNASANKNYVPSELKPYSGLVNRYHLPYDETIPANNLKDIPNCDVQKLLTYKIFITTCVGAGVLQGSRISSDFFTHTICDEASQCIEPETMIPIAFLKPKTGRVIMAGDPMQLPPLVINRFAARRGLSHSFFERMYTHYMKLTDGDKRLVIRLKRSYRALQSIMNFYSEQFYDSLMQSFVCNESSAEGRMLLRLQADKILPRAPVEHDVDENVPFGIYFINVEDGRNARQANSTSWMNDVEAEMVDISNQIKNSSTVKFLQIFLTVSQDQKDGTEMYRSWFKGFGYRHNYAISSTSAAYPEKARGL